MGLEATWSLVDIPSDARDAAQAAARREGVSVGEWLTRRILKRFSELNAREQEDAFVTLRNHVAQLADRLDHFEGHSRAEPMREALVKLHDGLTRLNEELVRTAGHSAIQISQLSSSLEVLSGSVEELRSQDVQSRDVFERRMVQLQEFVDGMNLRHSAETRSLAERMDTIGGTLAESRHMIASERTALERLEENLTKADGRYAGALRAMHGKFDDLSGRMAQAGTSASEAAAALDQRIAALQGEFGDAEARRRAETQQAAGRLDKLGGRIDELQADANGMCGALDRRVLLVQQALQSLDTRHGGLSQSLTRGVEAVAVRIGTVQEQSVQLSAGLERRLGDLERAVQGTGSADAATDSRLTAIEQRISEVANRAATAESNVAALLPRSQAIETQLEHLGQRFDAEAATQRQAVEDLKASLFEQTLNALGAKLEAESRKQQAAIADLKSGLLGELSQAFNDRLEADEHKQQDAIAQLQSGFATALQALGETFESEARKHSDAIAELKESLTAAQPAPATGQTHAAESDAPHAAVAMAKSVDAPAELHAESAEDVAQTPVQTDAAAAFWTVEHHEEPVMELTTVAPAMEPAAVEPVMELTAVAEEPHAATAKAHAYEATQSVEFHAPLPADESDTPPQSAESDVPHADESDTPFFPTTHVPEYSNDEFVPRFGGAGRLASASVMARNDAPDLSSSPSYLSAARQSLQAAAAQPDTDGSGNDLFASGLLRSLPMAGKQKGQATSYALVAGIGLVAVLAVVVGAVELTKRNSPPAPAHARHSVTAIEPAQGAARHVAVKKPALPHATATNEDRVTALAKGGDAQAQLLLGLRELAGSNEAEAAKWLERAAIQGLPIAQYRVGTLYASGRGVAADKAKAFHWYLAAAQRGNRKAMSNLAVAYAQGDGTPKNPQEAGRWFLKAAQLGLSDAQFDLAILYERGLGVPQNLTDAYRWYVIASKAGDKESKDRVDALSSQLTAEDRSAAETAAAGFKPLPVDARANEPQ